MPHKLETHVLTVDADLIHKVDTANPANLFGMWTDSVDQGRRLENLSWRLWQKEQLLDGSAKLPATANSTSASIAAPHPPLPLPLPTVPSDMRLPDLPQLSGSVDSLINEEDVEFTSLSAPDEIRPRIRRLDSSLNTRSRRDRRISSDDLEKMIVSIVKDKTRLSAPSLPAALSVSPRASSPSPPRAREAALQPRSTMATTTISPTTTTTNTNNNTAMNTNTNTKSNTAMNTAAMNTTTAAPPPQPSVPSSKRPQKLVTSSPSVLHAISPLRTFSPSQRRTSPLASEIIVDVIPKPNSSPPAQSVQPKKQPAKFALGGSCSSSEMGQSVENVKVIPSLVRNPVAAASSSPQPPAALPPALPAAAKQLGPSTTSNINHNRDNTTNPIHDTITASNINNHNHNNPTNHVHVHDTTTSVTSAATTTSTLPTASTVETISPAAAAQDAGDPAVDSDTDYIDESAIDDDDSSDWEDSVEDSGKSSVDDKYFQRVPSKVNLPSRPSLITLMLAQDERVKALGNQASQSTSALPRSRAGPGVPSLGVSPSDSDEGPLMMKGGGGGTMARIQPGLKPISEIPRSAGGVVRVGAAAAAAHPITVAAHPMMHAHAALSPRTTRRHMLATELTESLRRNLLWERSQKTSTANAVMKRRHTSQDVANLRQYPEKACMKEDDEGGDEAKWNRYFHRDANNGYHSKGW